MQYMTHPKHGAMHAYDDGEIERLEKSGWKKAEMPTAEELHELKKAQRAAALKAELAELEPVKAKPGRKLKVA